MRRIIGPMIEGKTDLENTIDGDDLRYCLDLGLVRLEDGKRPIISNPIYREITVWGA